MVREVNDISSINEKIKALYKITNELEAQFPGTKFTPDGHLIGSIGEVLASYNYGIELYENSHERHDGKAQDGREVQIKATQIDKVALSSEPDYLIVLKIKKDGTWEEIYNGPGNIVWNNCGKTMKTGQCHITLNKLVKLNLQVRAEDKIPLVI